MNGRHEAGWLVYAGSMTGDTMIALKRLIDREIRRAKFRRTCRHTFGAWREIQTLAYDWPMQARTCRQCGMGELRKHT